MKKILIYGRYSGSPKLYALVDDEDFERASQHSWYATTPNNRKGYIYSLPNGSGNGTLLLHRFIMGLEKGDGLIPDHINHDVWDNRRANLRVVTRAGNAANMRYAKKLSKTNTSGYRGVCFIKKPGTKNPWMAFVSRKYLGSYSTAEAAARAYDIAAVEKFGSHNAFVNFP
jgi:hypothetical protein